METIKEAATINAWDSSIILSENAVENAKYKGFINGVVWAERWIPVEEELPDNQDIVLVKTDKGCVSTAYLHGKESGFICYGDHGYSDFGKITYWRPINHE